ncbi:hypothetical protein PCE1_000680 [Barthelona sp. PCE]
MISLQNVVGCSGVYSDTIKLLPDGLHYVYSLGNSLVMSNINDSSDKIFFRGHDGPISCIAVDPSGRYCATGQIGQNSDVIVWDLVTNQMMYRFEEHDFGISALTFSSEGPFLISYGVSDDSHLIVWNISNGTIVAHRRFDRLQINDILWVDRVRDLKRRPTNQFLIALLGVQFVFLTFDPQEGSLDVDIDHSIMRGRDFTAGCISLDCLRIYAGTSSGDVYVIDIPSRRVSQTLQVSSTLIQSVLPGEDKDITSAGFYVGSVDGTIRFWSGDGVQFFEVSVQQLGNPICSCDILGTCQMLATTSTGEVVYVDVSPTTASQFPVSVLSHNHSDEIYDVSSMGNNFATVSKDGTVRVWDDAMRMLSCGYLQAEGHCVALGQTVAFVGCTDGSIRGHDTLTGEHIWVIDKAHTSPVTALLVMDKRHLLSGDASGTFRVWDVRQQRMLASIHEHTMPITSISLFADKKYALTSSSDAQFILWDLEAYRRISIHSIPQGAIYGLELCRDQKTILTASGDGRIGYWDITKTGMIDAIELEAGVLPTAIKLHEDNSKYIVGCSDGRIRVFSFTTAELTSYGTGHGHRITGIVSLGQNKWVSVGLDGAICMWSFQ